MGPRVVLLLSLFLCAAAGADDISMAANDAGEIVLPKAALAKGDFLIAVYAEKPEDLPVPPALAADLPGALPMNCLPLVRIESAAGHPSLAAAGEVSFGCRDLPERTGVFTLEGGRWKQVPTHRTQDGLIAASFVNTAVFGVFLLPESDLPRI